MINAQMRDYSYYRYNSDPDIYGQKTLIIDDKGEPVVQGTVKVAINNTSTAIQQNINYKEATYLGLTLNKDIDETFVIQYGDERLKVLYVNPQGRYRQVFMNSI